MPILYNGKRLFNWKEYRVWRKNVQTDAEARSELLAKGYTGVPVIYVDDEEIVGFDKAKLESLLEK